MATPLPSETHPDRAPAFPTTRWSGIVAQGSAQRDLESLAQAYWRPVFGAIRRHGHDPEDARDATQAFFTWLMERDALDAADPNRGRFRAFLKTLLERFLVAQHRRDTAAKRGGGRPTLTLDEASLPDLHALRLEEQPPDLVLDALWRAALVQRATDALERELTATGRGTQFAVFRDYFTSPDELDYDALAQRHAITKAQVSNALQRAKNRYRALLRAAVRETVRDEDEYRAELRWLFGGDA